MTKLTAEIPAAGIMKTNDFGDSIYYAVACQCGNPDDMIRFSVELEVDSYEITLNTEFTTKSSYWKTPFKETSNFNNSTLWSIDYCTRRFLNSIYHRVITSWEVWVYGYITHYESTIMSEQQALNYANTIMQSIENLNQLKSKNKEKYETDAQDGC